MNQIDLTEKQVECLQLAEQATDAPEPFHHPGINSWDFGSTTIAKLKRASFILRTDRGNYIITDSGREYLRRRVSS